MARWLHLAWWRDLDTRVRAGVGNARRSVLARPARPAGRAPAVHLMLAAFLTLLAAACAFSLSTFFLGLSNIPLTPKSFDRAGLSILLILFTDRDGLFATAILAALVSPLAVFGFGAILAAPLLVGLGSWTLARGLLRERVWAEKVSLLMLGWLAGGSALFAVTGPGNASAELRLANAILAPAFLLGAWALWRVTSTPRPAPPRPPKPKVPPRRIPSRPVVLLVAALAAVFFISSLSAALDDRGWAALGFGLASAFCVRRFYRWHAAKLALEENATQAG